MSGRALFAITLSLLACSWPAIAQQAGCVIKGNVSDKGERIYHVPGGAFYSKTVVDTRRGERWFCSEADAVNAGWRRSKR